MLILQDYEIPTVLAALRLFQQTPIPKELEDHFDGTTPLEKDEIDALCERLNNHEGANVVFVEVQKGKDDFTIIVEDSYSRQTATFTGKPLKDNLALFDFIRNGPEFKDQVEYIDEHQPLVIIRGEPYQRL